MVPQMANLRFRERRSLREDVQRNAQLADVMGRSGNNFLEQGVPVLDQFPGDKDRERKDKEGMR